MDEHYEYISYNRASKRSISEANFFRIPYL
jgi:hypothetical protein